MKTLTEAGSPRAVIAKLAVPLLVLCVVLPAMASRGSHSTGRSHSRSSSHVRTAKTFVTYNELKEARVLRKAILDNSNHNPLAGSTLKHDLGPEAEALPGWYKIDGGTEDGSNSWSVVRKPDGTWW